MKEQGKDIALLVALKGWPYKEGVPAKVVYESCKWWAENNHPRRGRASGVHGSSGEAAHHGVRGRELG